MCYLKLFHCPNWLFVSDRSFCFGERKFRTSHCRSPLTLVNLISFIISHNINALFEVFETDEHYDIPNDQSGSIIKSPVVKWLPSFIHPFVPNTHVQVLVQVWLVNVYCFDVVGGWSDGSSDDPDCDSRYEPAQEPFLRVKPKLIIMWKFCNE